MSGKNGIWDKVIFLVVLLAGMGFLIASPQGNLETVGIVVVAGGLMGLITAHTLSPLLAVLEKSLGGNFLSSSSSTPSPGQSGQSSQSL